MRPDQIEVGFGTVGTNGSKKMRSPPKEPPGTQAIRELIWAVDSALRNLSQGKSLLDYSAAQAVVKLSQLTGQRAWDALEQLTQAARPKRRRRSAESETVPHE